MTARHKLSNILRRDVIRGAILSAAAGALAFLRPSRAVAAEGHKKYKRRWGMVIDLDRCTGCGACVVACQQENNIPITASEGFDNHGAQNEWMSQLWQDPTDPSGIPEMLPFPCQHCADPPCTKVCPVAATYKDDEGVTVQVWDRCIGCRYCMVACPYSRRSFNWDAPSWDGNLKQLLNPDVATRPRGVVEKCTFCGHRIQAVKERAAMEQRPIADEEVKRLPACASDCPGGAITFGDLNDHESSVSRQARSPRAFRLLEELGTEPSVIYLKRDRRT